MNATPPPVPSPWPAPELNALQAAARVAHTPCGDGQLVWHLWGDAGPVVVLLHGGAGSWTHWVRNIGALRAAGWRVAAPDMPGFGDSAAPPDGHDADVLPHWLAEGLQQLLPGEPLSLVGFSFGGLVAGLMAAAGLPGLQRLVLVGAPALSAEPMAPLPLRAWDAQPPGPRRDAVHRHNLAMLMLHDPASIDEAALRLHAANIERDRLRRRRLMRGDLLLRTLPAVPCPVHGIWGEHDMLYRGRTAVIGHAMAQARQPGSLVFIPGAGHWVQYERAAAFDAALAQALARPVTAGR